MNDNQLYAAALEAVLFAVAADTFPAGKRGAFAAYGRIAKRIQGQPVPVPTR